VFKTSAHQLKFPRMPQGHTIIQPKNGYHAEKMHTPNANARP
jgi:hypothetical protein